MDYCPHTSDDVDQMQSVIGISSLDELFADIPEKFRLQHIPDIPPALSEIEILSCMGGLTQKIKCRK